VKAAGSDSIRNRSDVMPAAPVQPANPDRASRQAELRVNLASAPCTWSAYYLPKGAAPDLVAKTIPASVSVRPAGPVPGSPGREVGSLGGRGLTTSGRGDGNDTRQGTVVVAALGDAEAITQPATGVGDWLGVVRLQNGDRLVVPAAAVGLPGTDGVELLVGRMVRREGESWLAEVTW
jgi:hypothetical protein